jgi:thymidylate synthase
MNKLDKDYTALLQDILDNGVTKKDRTGTGTISVFGRQIRHKMSDGFPLLTTKKMYFKGIVAELLWFLRGDTNIKYLVDNGCHIWDGDAYKRFSQIRKSMLMLKPPASEDKLREYIEWYEQVTTQEEFINKIKTDDEFAKKWGDLGPIYGKQWRDWNGRKTDGFIEYETNGYSEHIKGIDQIANLINELKTNPDSRRIIVSAWNVGELDQMVLPPCHYGFQVYTRELTASERITYKTTKQTNFLNSNDLFDFIKSNVSIDLDSEVNKKCDESNIPTRAISLMWNQRSVDTPLGLPFNIASYGLLLTILGKMVNMVPNELIGNLGDCHIYLNQVDGVKEQLTREPYPLPTLKINLGNENWHLLELDEVLNTIDLDTTFKVENYQSHPTIKLPLSN